MNKISKMSDLNKYDVCLLNSETVTDPETGVVYTGMQIFKRLSENKSLYFMSERNYNYLYNVACLNASLERFLKNTTL